MTNSDNSDNSNFMKPTRDAHTSDIPTTERGRGARSPTELPKSGWRDILLRVWYALGEDNLGLVAAGVAFYFLLAIFPSIAAFVSLYGLAYDPADAQAQISSLADVMPSEARDLLLKQMESLTGGSGKALGFGAAIGILLAIWSAMKGTMALMAALNIVYKEDESRNFVLVRVKAFFLTIAAFAFTVISLALIAALPPLLQQLPLGPWVDTGFRLVRWPILALIFMFMLSGLYRFAPSRSKADWRWATPGSFLATILWLIGSALFSWYASSFASYNETYGSLGAVIILLMWFYVTAFIILLGGELNAEMEHQTRRDTTEGPDEPMGERGAYVADTIGRKP